MKKNLLSDTDYTSGHDNRYGATVLMGFVSKLECTNKRSSVRVIMPDRLDHEDNPLITKPIPVLQIASTAKKQFAMPRIGDTVACMKMPNSTTDYFVLGSFYTPRNPPPVSDPMLDHTTYDDGSTKEFNASNGSETEKYKGDVTWDHEGKGSLAFKGDVTLHSDGTILIEGVTLTHIKGPMKFEGNIEHIGNMSTTGIHPASDGPHAACGAGERLEQANIAARIYELERKVARLEAIIAAQGGTPP